MTLDVAVVIVSWNVRDYLSDCLRSVYRELQRSRLHGEVWVVDNASTDGTAELLQNVFPQAHLLVNDHNHGFGAANNQGMRAAAAHHPRYYFLLNPDTVLREGALKRLIGCLDERPEAGIAGARLVYGDGRFQHSAFSFPGLVQLAFDLFPMPARLYESRLNGRYPRHLYRPDHAPFRVDHTLGATMLVRASVTEATGGFDESFHMYCEEIDWSWRVQAAGWQIYTVAAGGIVHYGGESTKQIPARSVYNLWQSRYQLYKRHHGHLTQKVAAKMVAFALGKKAQQADDPELRAAYEQVISLWSTNGT